MTLTPGLPPIKEPTTSTPTPTPEDSPTTEAPIGMPSNKAMPHPFRPLPRMAWTTYSDLDTQKLLNELLSLKWDNSLQAQANLVCTVASFWVTPTLTKEQRWQCYEQLTTRLTRFKEERRRLGARTDKEEIIQTYFCDMMEMSKADITKSVWYDQSKESIWSVGNPTGIYRVEPCEEVYERCPDGWVRDFMNHSKYNQVNQAYYFWAAHTALGASVGRRDFVQAGNNQIYLNWMVFYISPRGSGKSTAMDVSTAVLEAYNDKLRFTHSRRDEAWYENQVHFIAEDCGVEVMGQQMKDIRDLPRRNSKTGLPLANGETSPGSFLMTIDELGVALGKGAHGVERKIPTYTKLYTSGKFQKSTIARGPEDVDEVHFSIQGCATVEWLQGTVTRDITLGGFMDRSIWVYRNEIPSRSYSSSELPIIDPVKTYRLARLLRAWNWEKGPMLNMMSLDPQAAAYVTEMYHEYKRKFFDPTIYTTQYKTPPRWESALLRMAASCLVSEAIKFGKESSFPIIRLEHVMYANEVNDLEDKRYDWLMSDIRKTPEEHDMDELESFIRANGSRMMQGELSKRKAGNFGGAHKMTKLLYEMKERGIVRDEKGERGGRVWILSRMGE